jgi:hypothetical protein
MEMLVIMTVAAAAASLMNIVEGVSIVIDVEVAKTVETVLIIVLTK